ncbi:MarR family transcriptional regulator [Aquibacillus sp. 3ASR75-11]|uniref:MarR family transcriptional regulator n=1 Tax=Terrihalobacillus insolitus TaxID=2950438 RepID=A0A9X4AN96_9BACI|nr:MarR family transcriptional regulator [Terrihalobacillus insolitus]MDC3413523.1 MarR family transcriptional regulator [Terrihalobacillus insolitus]MDC3426191.1 MarR family transcriptional regulator [Terrihalobacillus insolitus]
MNNFYERIGEIEESFFYIPKQLNRVFVGEEISPPRFFLLRAVERKGRCKVSDLSREFMLTSGATTIMVNGLKEAGLIHRFRDEKDRRVVWVETSEKGLRLVEQIKQKRLEVWKEMLDNLTSEELGQWLNLTRKIVFQNKQG